MSTTDRNKRLTLGVLVGWSVYKDVLHPYLLTVFQGVRAAAEARGCNLLLACGMDDYLDSGLTRPAWPEVAPDSDFVPVGPWNTDGIIAITPIENKRHAAYLQQLRTAHHPLVFVGAGEPGPAVVADNESGIDQAIAHLAAHNHRRIAFIAGQTENIDNVLRLNAYQAAMRRYQLAADPALIVSGEGWQEPSRQALARLLEKKVPFTAVLACNDESAVGDMQALQAAGLRVPQDVAVVGFDNATKALLTVPRLTTVHQSMQECGYQAVDLLLEYIQGQAQAETIRKLPTRLVIRESCGCTDGAGETDHSIPNGSSEQLRILSLITAAAQTETHHLRTSVLQSSCQRLLNGLVTGTANDNSAILTTELANILRETEELETNPYIWLAAVQALADQLPAMMDAWQLPASAQNRANENLWQAQRYLTRYSQRHFNQSISGQGWIASEMGLLTAQLLVAKDEDTVLKHLIRYRTHLGIRNLIVGFFETDDDNPVAWSILHWQDGAGNDRVSRISSQAFPPAELLLELGPFQLTVWPLVMQTERYGFVAFDIAQIELSAPIVRELAYAIKIVRLYQQARHNQQLAEEANRLKSRFLSMINHELSTPLNVIKGFSQMLLHTEGQTELPPLPVPYRLNVEHIHTNAEHLGWLIRDLLDLASSEAGQLRLVCEPLDLADSLQVAVKTGAFLSQSKGLTWEAQIPDHLPQMWGDRTRIRQVTLNLISNAVKFTSSGRVRLCAEVTDADTIMVSVSDTGLGIAPGEQQVIFDEFRLSDRTSARGYGGLGLGLAICKRLVELHGGQIGVHSTGQEGDGSTFYFTLPILTHPTRLGIPASTALKTLALLTREAESSAALCEQLRSQGYQVTPIHFEQNPNWLTDLLNALPGAVALDFDTTAGQGWNILKVVRENPLLQGLPVLFYMPTQADAGGSILELDYLSKPLDSAELAQAFARQGWPVANASDDHKTILIVDDNPTILEMHTRIVQTVFSSCHILTANHGQQALTLLAQSTVDLVLLDLMMPEVSGFDVLESMQAQAATRNIPVIVLTAQVLTETDMERLNRGVATILQKGVFSVDETVTHIATALKRSPNLGKVAQRVVRQAMAYIHAHYAEPLARDKVARHVGVNADYLARCFRQETGLTPKVYLNRYRINRAKSLLVAGKQNIEEIAVAVGFGDGKYFSYAFQHETGMTPGAYRRSQSPGLPNSARKT